MLLFLLGSGLFCYVLYLILMTVIDQSGIVKELQEIKILLKKLNGEIEENSKEIGIEENILSTGECPACGEPLAKASRVCPGCGLVLNQEEEE